MGSPYRHLNNLFASNFNIYPRYKQFGYSLGYIWKVWTIFFRLLWCKRLKTALCPKSPTHPCWQKTFHYNRLQMPSMKEDFQETNTVIQSFNIEIRLIPTLFWSFWHWNSKLTFPKRPRLGWWQRRVQSASPRNWLPAFSFRNDFRQIK